MNFKNSIDCYGSAVILFFIIIIAFTPLPIYILSVFTWIILFIMVYQITNKLDLALFLGTTFLILLLIFRKLSSNDYVENFDGGNPAVDIDASAQSAPSVDDKIAEDAITNLILNDTDEVLQDNNLEKALPKDNKKGILNALDDKVFSTITEEDSEDSEDTDDEEVFAKGNKRKKRVGKTKMSSKTAYKAQKDLYNLYNTTKLLKETLSSMSPALANGQKIVEKMQSLGIMDKV